MCRICHTPSVIGWKIWVTFRLSLRCNLHLVLKLSNYDYLPGFGEVGPVGHDGLGEHLLGAGEGRGERVDAVSERRPEHVRDVVAVHAARPARVRVESRRVAELVQVRGRCNVKVIKTRYKGRAVWAMQHRGGVYGWQCSGTTKKNHKKKQKKTDFWFDCQNCVRDCCSEPRFISAPELRMAECLGLWDNNPSAILIYTFTRSFSGEQIGNGRQQGPNWVQFSHQQETCRFIC